MSIIPCQRSQALYCQEQQDLEGWNQVLDPVLLVSADLASPEG